MNFGTENDKKLEEYKGIVKSLIKLDELQELLDYLEYSEIIIAEDEVSDAMRTLQSNISEIYSDTNKHANKILKDLKLIK